MRPIAQLLATAGTLTLVSLVPATVPASARLSPEVLRLMDPTTSFGQACGGGKKRSLLPQRVQFAMLQAAPDYDVEPPLYEGLGGVDFGLSSNNAEARAYFNQGLMLLYGFNHQEAILAFRAAARRDPDCAACHWGEAFAYGPNINAPMDPATNAPAWAALQKAQALKDKASPRERALIDALAARYAEAPPADRAPLDKAFAAAMLTVAKDYPLDSDIAVLAAEAVMTTSPWDYWEADGTTSRPHMPPAIDLVEKAMARAPNHPQAAHLYIHLLEASTNPAQAEAAADRLSASGPSAAGHLVHMPGHLFYRVGRYADAIRVNIAAAQADEAYLKGSSLAGIYRFAYYPHNVHFIVSAAQMAGDLDSAVSQAEKLRSILNPEVTLTVPFVQPVDAAPYLAHAHFSSPATILALPAPDPRLRYVTAMYHFARAIAQAQLKSRRGFDAELDAMLKIGRETDWKPLTDGLVPVPALLEVAENVARGRLAMAEKRYADAVGFYRKGAEAETRVNYTEPPYWYYPVNQSLGGALYMTGDYEGAEAAFAAALTKYPGNAWALWGLAETQRKTGDAPGATASMAAFEKAWLGPRNWLTMAKL
jgi:tetratricopeptide (TPR) repeat protein